MLSPETIQSIKSADDKKFDRLFKKLLTKPFKTVAKALKNAKDKTIKFLNRKLTSKKKKSKKVKISLYLS